MFIIWARKHLRCHSFPSHPTGPIEVGYEKIVYLRLASYVQTYRKIHKNAKTVGQAILKVVRRNSENLFSSNKKQSKFGHWYFTGNFIGYHKPAREKRVLTISTPKSSKHKGLWLSPIMRTATPQRGKSANRALNISV